MVEKKFLCGVKLVARGKVGHFGRGKVGQSVYAFSGLRIISKAY